jgi:hypothetical protein
MLLSVADLDELPGFPPSRRFDIDMPDRGDCGPPCGCGDGG